MTALTLTAAERRHLETGPLKGQQVLFTTEFVRTGQDGTWHDTDDTTEETGDH